MIAIFRAAVAALLLLSVVVHAAPGGDFQLLDHRGEQYRLQQDRGKLVLLFFGYTACPDICPATMSHVAAVLESLGDDASRVQGLFVTVDPQRDNVELLGQYVPWFSDNIKGLTGSVAQIEQIARQYRVRFELQKSAPNDTHYTVDHSTDLYLIGVDGEIEALIPYGLPVAHTLAVVRSTLANSQSSGGTAADQSRSARPLPPAPIDLQAYRGAPLLLNFWASWCGPCRAEIPSLNRSYALHREIGLNMIAINIGEKRSAVEAFLRDYPIDFGVALDPAGESFERWNIVGLPATLVFDHSGREVLRVIGERDWASADMLDEVRGALVGSQ